MLAACRLALLPFPGFTPDDVDGAGHQYGEIRDNAFGWKMTDYAESDFSVRTLDGRMVEAKHTFCTSCSGQWLSVYGEESVKTASMPLGD